MRDSVRNAFLSFTEPMEAAIPWMYPDVKKLVSIGLGNLLDTTPENQTPPEVALRLALRRPDGALATREEIAAEWLAVKNFPGAALGGHTKVEKVAKLRLPRADVERLAWRTLEGFEVVLVDRLPDFETYPADAQLCIISLAWACGPHFHFPKCIAALKAWDFRTAAVESQMSLYPGTTFPVRGLIPRNKAHDVLLRNAAVVQQQAGLDANTLYWPRDLDASEAVTEPEIVNPPSDLPQVNTPIIHNNTEMIEASIDEYRKRNDGEE